MRLTPLQRGFLVPTTKQSTLVVQDCPQKIVKRQHSLVINESIVDGHKFNICLDVQKQKENPAKGRVSRLLVGRVSLFPLREETLLTDKSCLRNLAEQAPTYQLVD